MDLIYKINYEKQQTTNGVYIYTQHNRRPKKGLYGKSRKIKSRREELLNHKLIYFLNIIIYGKKFLTYKNIIYWFKLKI